jgi:murein DD-endopeptidase MepM/ murein hydrolase activator NlpD
MHKTTLKWLVLVTLTTLILLFSAIILYQFYQGAPVPEKIEKPSKTAFNINIDSLHLTTNAVKNGQNLSEILTPYCTPQLIDRIAKETRVVFDVRKIRPGNKYAIISTADSLHKTLYFIYEINDVDFVVYDLRDSLRAYLDKKDVSTSIKTASGTITTSLWNTFQQANLNVELGLALADVYAWTVDFYGLQKGDHFKVIYEESAVEGRSVGGGRILAAIFSSSGKDYYAFLFNHDTVHGYFDETGKSLRRSFLKAPLHFSRISSRFSRSRMHPILKIRRPHFGVDYSAPSGTPVVALGDGRVAEAGWKGGFGRCVTIRHNSVYTTSYAHLSGFGKGITPGAHVRQGQVIGFVGSSGLSTGPHLDFRVYKNGSPTDPLHMESPPTNPVNKAWMAEYDSLVKKYSLELDSIK